MMWLSNNITAFVLKKRRGKNIYLYFYSFTGLAANCTSQFRAFTTVHININRLTSFDKEV